MNIIIQSKLIAVLTTIFSLLLSPNSINAQTAQSLAECPKCGGLLYPRDGSKHVCKITQQRNNNNSSSNNNHQKQQQINDQLESLQKRYQSNIKAFQQFTSSILGAFEANEIKKGISAEEREIKDAFNDLENDLRSGKHELKECDDCDGSGRKRCEKCNGKGGTECIVCSGTGKAYGSKCSNCEGEGYRTCWACYKRGSVKCYDCKGTGYVKKMISEESNRENLTNRNDVFNSDERSEPTNYQSFNKKAESNSKQVANVGYPSSDYENTVKQNFEILQPFDLVKEYAASEDLVHSYSFEQPLKNLTEHKTRESVVNELKKLTIDEIPIRLIDLVILKRQLITKVP